MQVNKKKQKNIKKSITKPEDLKKLKSLHKKGLLKFDSKEIASAILEDFRLGITEKKTKGKD